MQVKHHKIGILSCFIFIYFVFLPIGSGASLEQKLRKALEDSKVPSHQLGIIVSDASNSLYQLNADKSFIPASLMKIFYCLSFIGIALPVFSVHHLFYDKKQN